MKKESPIGAIIGLACFLCKQKVPVDFNTFVVLKRLNGEPVRYDADEPVICNNCVDNILNRRNGKGNNGKF